VVRPVDSVLLGESGLRVSRIGLGLAALGRPGYINLGHQTDIAEAYDVSSMEAMAHTILDAAWDAGVRYFDAARSYGRAEQFLAHWLTTRQITPDAVTVGSKWGYIYTAGWKVEAEKHEVKDHSLENLVRQAAESREILGPHLDLYQIHSATRESGVLEDRAVLEELDRLKGRGMKIGLSVSGPRQGEIIRRAIEIEVAGRRLFDSVQATWNLLEPSAGPALEEAHAAGVGVIVKEALANGRLTGRNHDPAFGAKRRALESLATEVGTTVDALSLAAVIAEPWVGVVLSGAATMEQLRGNLAATSVHRDVSMDDRLRSLAETPEEYWETRSKLPWN
jgi:aryl-alcohol dehydrogenase-like predicted oxidoreductase